MTGAGWVTVADRWAAFGIARLVQASLQGAVFILLVWVVCRTLARRSAAVRSRLWWLVCIKLLLGLVWSPGFPSFSAGSAPLTLTIPFVSSIPLLDPILEGWDAGPPRGPAAPETPTAGTPDRGWRRPSPAACALLLWILGAACFVVAHMLRAISARRLVARSCPVTDPELLAEAARLADRLGLRRRPSLRRSPLATGPVVIGPARPIVLLPERIREDLSVDELRMVLAHELAHVRRFDLAWAGGPALMQIALYFHPLAWIAGLEWKLNCEAACDEIALRCTGAPPVSYGRMLVKMASESRPRRPLAALGASSGYVMLRGRLKMIQDQSRVPGSILRWGVPLVLIVGTVCIVPWRVAAGRGRRAAPVAAVANGRESVDPAVRRIVARVRSAYDGLSSFSAHLDARFTGATVPGLANVDADVRFKRPSFAAIDVHTPGRNLHAASDGKQTFVLDSKLKGSYTRKAEPSNLKELLGFVFKPDESDSTGMTSMLAILAGAPLLESFTTRASLGPDTVVDGAPVRVLREEQQVPKSPLTRMTIAVGSRDYLIRRITMETIGGSRKTSYVETVSGIKIDPAVSAADFTFTPPAGAREVVAPVEKQVSDRRPPLRSENGILYATARPPLTRAVGTVVLPDGKPAVGARVSWIVADEQGNPRQAATEATDADGRFRFRDPGRWSRGARSNVLFCDAGGRGAGFVALGRNDERIRLALSPPAELRLALHDEAGLPAVGVPIRIQGLNAQAWGADENGKQYPIWMDFPDRGDHRRIAVTDSAGRCSFAGLPSGCTARLVMEDSRFEQLSGERFARLGPGPVTAPPPIALHPGASIHGRVVYDATGKPAAGIPVFGVKHDAEGNGAGGRAVSDAAGRFTIDHLPPGRYVASVIEEDAGFAKDWTAHAVRGIVVPKGGRAEAGALRLIPGVVVTGRATASTGEPIARLMIVGSADDVSNVATTDDAGRYFLRLPGGKQHLYVAMDLPGFASLNKQDAAGHYEGMRDEYQRDLSLRDAESDRIDFKLPRK